MNSFIVLLTLFIMSCTHKKVTQPPAEIENLINKYVTAWSNGWEHVRISEGNVLVKMNFTRHLKDGIIMGNSKRTASYVVRGDRNSAFKIFSVIHHALVTE